MSSRPLPLSVSSTLRPRRRNSSTPNSRSSDLTWVVTVGCETPSAFAAAVKLPPWATAWNERSWVCLI